MVAGSIPVSHPKPKKFSFPVIYIYPTLDSLRTEKDLHVVLLQRTVRREQGHFFGAGLGDEHAVEWVAVGGGRVMSRFAKPISRVGCGINSIGAVGSLILPRACLMAISQELAAEK